MATADGEHRMPELYVQGQQVRYSASDMTPPWRTGDTALVFIHGVGADRDIWCEWLPHLAGLFPVIRLDLPGHGGSAPWRGDRALSFDFYVELVRGVAEAEGAKHLVLVGESMGGTIALCAAAELGERVRAVATCSTAHRGGTLRHVADWRMAMERDGFEAWSRDMLEKRFLPGSVPAPVRSWFHGVQCTSDPETILAMATVLVGADLTGRLDAVRAPVLLMQPDASPFIPLAIPAELKDLLPNGRLMVIASSRHGIACSHARECAEATRAFLVEHGMG